MTVIDGAWAPRDEPTALHVDPLRHRETVIRRLLDLGVSPVTLGTILPDFRTLVDRLAPRR